MEIISFRFQDFLSAFIILFAVIDITGLTPIIIDMKQKGQNIIAWKAAVYSLVTFLAFLFMGCGIDRTDRFPFDCRRRLFYDSAVVEGSVWVG